MKCPICQAATRVRHTHIIGDCKTVERVCQNGHKLTYVVTFLCEVRKRGDGAYALAQAIKKGKTKIHVRKENPGKDPR